uniref:Calcium uniporter protein n=1 Tax=Haemonchus contortus TaxID=6289 RepID=A0A7I4YPF7_HAECO
MCSRSDHEFSKERQAEERKLIDEIRNKRAYIETVSKFPEEEDIQHGDSLLILSGTVALMTSLPKFEDEDPFFQPMGKQRYTEVIWKECLEVGHDAERIRSTAEKLSMAYEVYCLLILSDGAILFYRKNFFRKDEQGVLLEPSYTADFIRKELELLKQFRRKGQNEIEEAKRQEENENHRSTFDQMKEMIEDLRRDIHVKHMELQTEMDNQRESMKTLCEKFEK